MGANLELDLLAIDFNSFVLKVWLPNFLGVALAETDIAAVLFALAGEITLLHYYNSPNSEVNCTDNRGISQPKQSMIFQVR